MQAQVTLDRLVYTFEQKPVGDVLIQRLGHFGSLLAPPEHAKIIFHALRMYDGHPMYRTIDVEGALCAWECLLEWRPSVAQRNDPEWQQEYPVRDRLEYHFEMMGTSAMRHCAMEAGVIAERVFSYMDSLGIEYWDMSYDWDFVPAVLAELDWDALIQGNQYGGPPYQPDYPDLFAKVRARLGF